MRGRPVKRHPAHSGRRATSRQHSPFRGLFELRLERVEATGDDGVVSVEQRAHDAGELEHGEACGERAETWRAAGSPRAPPSRRGARPAAAPGARPSSPTRTSTRSPARSAGAPATRRLSSSDVEARQVAQLRELLCPRPPDRAEAQPLQGPRDLAAELELERDERVRAWLPAAAVNYDAVTARPRASSIRVAGR